MQIFFINFIFFALNFLVLSILTNNFEIIMCFFFLNFANIFLDYNKFVFFL